MMKSRITLVQNVIKGLLKKQACSAIWQTFIKNTSVNAAKRRNLSFSERPNDDMTTSVKNARQFCKNRSCSNISLTTSVKNVAQYRGKHLYPKKKSHKPFSTTLVKDTEQIHGKDLHYKRSKTDLTTLVKDTSILVTRKKLFKVEVINERDRGISCLNFLYERYDLKHTILLKIMCADNLLNHYNKVKISTVKNFLQTSKVRLETNEATLLPGNRIYLSFWTDEKCYNLLYSDIVQYVRAEPIKKTY